MADRTFNQFCNRLEKKVVELWATLAFTGSAAGTLSNAKGIVSIAKDGSTAGQYIVTLKDKYKRLLGVEVTFLDGSAVPLTCFHSIKAEDVATNKTITLNFAAANKALTDPAVTSVAKIHIMLANTDVP